MGDLFNKQESLFIENKIIQILDIISNRDFNQDKNLGLMGGMSGISLFYLECFKHFKDERHLDLGIEILDKVISKCNLNNKLSFCDGLSGIGWLIGYADQCGYIEKADDMLEDIDSHIFEYFMVPTLNQNFFDFLYGAIGSGIYFLSRAENDRVLTYIQFLISNIAEKLRLGDDKFGLEYTSINKKNQYDLGISHGIPSVLYFLVSTFKANIMKEQSLECIKIIIKFLQSTITVAPGNKSYFPYSADNKGEGSRLAWCYGDLGICAVLLNASKAIKDLELEKSIIEIIRYNSKRTDDAKNGINDASFCHGSSGVAHIFSNWYQLYNIEDCKRAARFWYNYTTKLASPFFIPECGYRSYKSYDKSFHENDSLLEGNVGVGLSLLSAINSNIKEWNKSLLLQ